MYEMFEFLHGAPYAICIELKCFYLCLCVLFWRHFVCFVGGWWSGDGGVKSGDGSCWWG